MLSLYISVKISNIDWKSQPDPGSKVWCVSNALSYDAIQDFLTVGKPKKTSLVSDSSTLISNHRDNATGDELPEDKFHRKDITSSHFIDQQRLASKNDR
jgi:hypothetical protein